MNKKLTLVSISTSSLIAILMGTSLRADEPVDASARYEKDAWYDVTEWFDGNDYNPTDEAIGRWDDERFSYYDAASSSDVDDDAVDGQQFYGAVWDDGIGQFSDLDGDGLYESYARYHDTDNDNLYDLHAIYNDDNGDGLYDSYKLSELSHTPDHAIHSSKVAQTTREGLSGKREKVSGKIAETTYVRRVGGMSYLVRVDSGGGKPVWVDLGSNSRFQLFKGDSVIAYGPMVKAGAKQVLVATMVDVEGKQVPVTRTGGEYRGTIKSTRTATVRGDKRTVAKVETENGKMLTVDMGAASKAGKYSDGDEVTVRGVPVKIGDRVILVADQSSL